MKEGRQVMPPLSAEEFKGLKEDIGEHGVLVPVVVDGEDRIIDGHHRVRAWKELKAEGRNLPDYPVEVQDHLETEDQKRDLAWKFNMLRRHLTQAQKREVIADKLRQSPEWADNRIATLLGVHPATVGNVRRYLEATLQIAKLTHLVGQDNKQRPRSRFQVNEGQLARKEIPITVSTVPHISEKYPESYSVTVRHIDEWRESKEGPETRHRVEGARKGLSELRTEIIRTEPETVAQLSLDPYQPLGNQQVEREKRKARELIEWLEGYIAALEALSKPGVRPVK